jgi:hypothetical protein
MAEYRPTLFDRHGPAAADRLRVVGYGVMVFCCTLGLFTMLGGGLSIWGFVMGLAGGLFATGAMAAMSKAAGDAWAHATMSGASTPYEDQYSYQQSLVMQRKIDEALASYEDVIATSPNAVAPRMLAAELYAKHDGARRAAELLREVQRMRTVTSGEDINATNRLVDLLAGPLRDPGRACVELRRLIDRYPGTGAATHARRALARIKASMPNDP